MVERDREPQELDVQDEVGWFRVRVGYEEVGEILSVYDIIFGPETDVTVHTYGSVLIDVNIME